MKKSIIFIAIVLAISGMFFKDRLQEIFFPTATIQSVSSVSEQDYDIVLKGVNVPDANLKDFRGKVIFLNFWGTWCPPCREEWPTIQKLYDTKKNKMEFVLIVMHDKEDIVRKYLSDNQFSAPVYIAESPISQSLLPKSFPTTYVISQDGQILKKEDTAEDWNSAEMHNFLDKILK